MFVDFDQNLHFFVNFPSFLDNLLILNHFSKSKLYTEDTRGSHFGKPKRVCMVVTLYTYKRMLVAFSAVCSVHSIRSL